MYVENIERISRKRVKVIITTCRGYLSAERYIYLLGLQQLFIAYNGAPIYQDGEIMRKLL